MKSGATSDPRRSTLALCHRDCDEELVRVSDLFEPLKDAGDGGRRCRQAAALPLNTRCCKSKLGFLPVLSCVSSLIAAELDDRGAIHLFAPLHGREELRV